MSTLEIGKKWTELNFLISKHIFAKFLNNSLNLFPEFDEILDLGSEDNKTSSQQPPQPPILAFEPSSQSTGNSPPPTNFLQPPKLVFESSSQYTGNSLSPQTDFLRTWIWAYLQTGYFTPPTDFFILRYLNSSPALNLQIIPRLRQISTSDTCI